MHLLNPTLALLAIAWPFATLTGARVIAPHAGSGSLAHPGPPGLLDPVKRLNRRLIDAALDHEPTPLAGPFAGLRTRVSRTNGQGEIIAVNADVSSVDAAAAPPATPPKDSVTLLEARAPSPRFNLPHKPAKPAPASTKPDPVSAKSDLAPAKTKPAPSPVETVHAPAQFSHAPAKTNDRSAHSSNAPAKTKPKGKPMSTHKASPTSHLRPSPTVDKCKRADDIAASVTKHQELQRDIFKAVSVKGAKMRTILKDAYRSGSSDKTSWMPFTQKYTLKAEDMPLPAKYADVAKALEAIGLNMGGAKWQSAMVYSKGREETPGEYIVKQFMLPREDTIILGHRKAADDTAKNTCEIVTEDPKGKGKGSKPNPQPDPKDKGKQSEPIPGTDFLPASELSWYAWRHGAHAASSQLKYIAMHDITNTKTRPVMEVSERLVANLAKSKAEEDFDKSMLTTALNKKKGPKYRVFHAAENAHPKMVEAFTGLLGTPNVQAVAHMVADHQSDLGLKKITKIHAFYDTLKPGEYQMVVELGNQ